MDIAKIALSFIGAVSGAFFLWWFIVHNPAVIDDQKKQIEQLSKVIAESKLWSDAVERDYNESLLRETDIEKIKKDIDDAPKTGCGSLSPALRRVVDRLRS